MNIPHIIHYCWYGGGKMNHILRQCKKSFHKFGCDKIIFWNDSNSNVYDNELLRFLVVKKEWAFVSDFFRLKVLYEYGGVYLDTDIQALKPLPDEFYEAEMVLGYGFDNLVSTAFIMVKPKHPFIKYIIDIHEGYLRDKRKVINNNYITQGLMDYYPNFRLDGMYREFAKGCFIYPRSYFDSATFKRNAGYCIHHGMVSWLTPSNPIKRALRPTIKLLRFYIRPFGIWYQNWVNKKMMLCNERFTEIYKKNIANKGD